MYAVIYNHNKLAIDVVKLSSESGTVVFLKNGPVSKFVSGVAIVMQYTMQIVEVYARDNDQLVYQPTSLQSLPLWMDTQVIVRSLVLRNTERGQLLDRSPYFSCDEVGVSVQTQGERG